MPNCTCDFYNRMKDTKKLINFNVGDWCQAPACIFVRLIYTIGFVPKLWEGKWSRFALSELYRVQQLCRWVHSSIFVLIDRTLTARCYRYVATVSYALPPSSSSLVQFSILLLSYDLKSLDEVIRHISATYRYTVQLNFITYFKFSFRCIWRGGDRRRQKRRVVLNAESTQNVSHYDLVRT